MSQDWWDYSKSKYLTRQSLLNLKHYKYSAVDKSPISKYILQPYWTFCVRLFPMWMAPNLITLIGLSFVAWNVLFTTIWMPDMREPADGWLYVSFCLGIWLYSTFDNVDGKQARRTNSSSPLGELFDHGCDALNCCLGAIIQSAALATGFTWQALVIAFLAICPFYFSTWEEYYTGCLYLGYINGPTEGLLISCVTMLISAAYGPHVWHLPLLYFIPNNMVPAVSDKLLHLSVIDLMMIIMITLLFLVHIPFSLYNVYRAVSSSSSAQTQIQGNRKFKFSQALLNLLPIFVYFASWFFWTAAPGSTVINQHCIHFIINVGVIFAHMATNVILAYLTRSEYPLNVLVMLPLLVGAVLANAHLITGGAVQPLFYPGSETEHYYLWLMSLISVSSYLRWVLQIISKFCAYLGISCLSIPYSPPATSSYTHVE